MNAEILSIGDELLIGQTINTNSAWLGEQLGLIGVRVVRTTVIGDSHTDILEALGELTRRSSLVIITGGLGPTRDDITKVALCDFFGTRLIIHPEIEARLKAYFEGRGLPFLETNRQQAALPEDCTVIANTRGTASGMWFEHKGRVVISLPGVPFEMEGLMADELLEKIRVFFACPEIVHRTILTQGIGESFLAEKISHWEDSLAKDGISLAYLPSPGQVKLRLSAYGGDYDTLPAILDERQSELMELIGSYVYGFGKDTIQGVVGEALRVRGETLSLAESCTGGYIGHLITSVSGSSDYFIGAVTTYHERIKSQILGINPELIHRHGVVSREVAMAMAQGARDRLATTWALSTTGIAGPSGGTDENPVGTIWIGIAGPTGVNAIRSSFGKNRQRTIVMAANSALNMLRKEIQTRVVAD